MLGMTTVSCLPPVFLEMKMHAALGGKLVKGKKKKGKLL